jgi:hypothetical protein
MGASLNTQVDTGLDPEYSYLYIQSPLTSHTYHGVTFMIWCIEAFKASATLKKFYQFDLDRKGKVQLSSIGDPRMKKGSLPHHAYLAVKKNRRGVDHEDLFQCG